MPKFQMQVTLSQTANYTTARVADGTLASEQLAEADVNKLVKLVGDSRYGLCAVGDQIEGVLEVAGDNQPQDGFAVGTVRTDHRLKVTLDGLQATPGTGAIAIGDYVVAGTVVARGTVQGSVPPKVCKATAAPGGLVHKWRLVSILSGTTAVGGVGVIERV